jgi:sulfopyruvate decarboxylase TPP-binding subunit
MLDALAVVNALQTCGISHIVWIPDSHLGNWEKAILECNTIRLIRATREGEAIAIAGGLLLGGARPLVVIQCTGLFEAGDALRNIVHDLQLPLLLIVGVRSYQAWKNGKTTDNCPVFTEPILNAWQIPHSLIDPNLHSEGDLIHIFRENQRSGKSLAIMWAE